MTRNIIRDIKKQVKFNDNPIHKSIGSDYASNLVNWNVVEECLNLNLFKFEIISNSSKQNIYQTNYFWYSTPVQDKNYIFNSILSGATFVLLEYRNKYTSELLYEIEKNFDVVCDAHVYGGISTNSKSFSPHVDIPSNFIVQVEGETLWRIYKNTASDLFSQEEINSTSTRNDLELDFEVMMTPGDILYIPARRFHEAIPNGKRLSISIPCRSKKYDRSVLNLDRNYYAF
jgi:hypothetical protein